MSETNFNTALGEQPQPILTDTTITSPANNNNNNNATGISQPNTNPKCANADLELIQPTSKTSIQDDNDDSNVENAEELMHEQISMGLHQVVKHPLQNVWTLWYLEKDRTKAWEDMQNEIMSFDTVEDFWSLYNHIKPPSEIKVGSDYSMFKKGIRPMWEDAANRQGGRWVITLNKNAKSDLDTLWLDVLLCLIGEAFQHSQEICGAVVNIRAKTNKISVWTANGDHAEAALEIGQKLRECLRLGKYVLQYELHRDTMVKQGANVQAIYTL